MSKYNFEKIADFGRVKRFMTAFRIFTKIDTNKLNEEDRRALMVNLGLTNAKNNKDIDKAYNGLSKSERDMIRLFVSNNLRNIRWYELKIIKENTYRLLYSFITALFVFSIPALIGYATYFSDSLKYDGAELIGTSLTVLLSGVLGVHKMVSSWVEKRKYRSHFFQAKIDLQNILFTMDENFETFLVAEGLYTDLSTVKPEDALRTDKEERESGESETIRIAKFSTEMHEELFLNIKESRSIVQTETKVFFEMSSTTTFDLGSILSQSGKTAKSLISTFKSHSYDLDEKKKKEEELKEEKKKEKEARIDSEFAMKSAVIKLERLSHKEMLLLEKLEVLKNSSKTEDISECKQIELKLEMVQVEIEKIELEGLKLKMQSDMK